MADDNFEYSETTSEMDQGHAAPPPGTGWEHVSDFAVGSLRVHRWRRMKKPMERLKSCTVVVSTPIPLQPKAVLEAMLDAADKLGVEVTLVSAEIVMKKAR